MIIDFNIPFRLLSLIKNAYLTLRKDCYVFAMSVNIYILNIFYNIWLCNLAGNKFQFDNIYDAWNINVHNSTNKAEDFVFVHAGGPTTCV